MKVPTPPREPSSTSHVVESFEDDCVDDWIDFVEESEEQVVGDEVDSYLLDPLEKVDKETKGAFKILSRWKTNGCKYPILAAIAKDVFAIQASTVASESAFSTGGRVISDFRSSLTPKSVEALICMHNWMRGDGIITLEDDAPSLEHLEFYESIEAELLISSISSLSINNPEQQASSSQPLTRPSQASASQASTRPPRASKGAQSKVPSKPHIPLTKGVKRKAPKG